MKDNKPSQPSRFKKIYHTLHSMKFGMVLLLIIGVLSIIGTILPQDRPLSFYQDAYHPFLYGIIETFQLQQVYTSWWFLFLIALLSVNLLLCSILRLPKLVKKMKEKPHIPTSEKDNPLLVLDANPPKNPGDVFKKTGFRAPVKLAHDRREIYYQKKHALGHLGSWFTHVGLLIVFISYLFGQVAGFETFFYGVPGVRGEIEHTNLELAIEDFSIDYREDNSIHQYTSDLRVYSRESDRLIKEGVSKVNDPLRVEGLSIYQNGTGWAVDLNLYKEGQVLRDLTLYEGEIHVDDDQRIAIQFYDFFPDLVRHQGMPRSQSPFPDNPHMLYVLYYEGFRADMNVVGMGEEIRYEEYAFSVEDPRHFTYLQIVRDPGIPGALAGGLLLTLGVFLAFYLHPKALMVERKADGALSIWSKAPKGALIFQKQIKTALKEGSPWE